MLPSLLDIVANIKFIFKRHHFPYKIIQWSYIVDRFGENKTNEYRSFYRHCEMIVINLVRVSLSSALARCERAWF